MNHPVRIGRTDPGKILLTVGHGPFPRSLNQVISVSVLTCTRIYAHTNMRARWLGISTESYIRPENGIVTYHNPMGLYRDPV